MVTTVASPVPLTVRFPRATAAFTFPTPLIVSVLLVGLLKVPLTVTSPEASTVFTAGLETVPEELKSPALIAPELATVPVLLNVPTPRSTLPPAPTVS